ncbi:MAG: DUF4113 domain-containing protein [Acidithiobacillus sp.]
MNVYTVRATQKLRQQESVCGAVRIDIRTNPFRPDKPQYHASQTVALAIPSQDTRILIKAALSGLRHIYRPQFAYAKAGVYLTEIRSVHQQQRDLFAAEALDIRSDQLMKTLDAIHTRFGHNALQPGVAGLQGQRDWSMKRGNKSPSYTTCWSDLARARS